MSALGSEFAGSVESGDASPSRASWLVPQPARTVGASLVGRALMDSVHKLDAAFPERI
jgi:hypothetical protein